MKNIAQVFELALAKALTETADIRELPRIRCWRGLETDFEWDTDNDRVLPQIAIMATTPSSSDNMRTFEVRVDVALLTDSADDQNHADFVLYEEAVQGVIDKIFAQHINTDGAELEAFESEVARLFSADYTISIGGYTLGEGDPVTVDDGANIVTWELVVHYSRSDT